MLFKPRSRYILFNTVQATVLVIVNCRSMNQSTVRCSVVLTSNDALQCLSKKLRLEIGFSIDFGFILEM